jgi:cell wall-associated NlpC family hydrolase
MREPGLPDPRRNAYRDDLAAEGLRGKVKAPAYSPGSDRQFVFPATPLRARPDARASWTTEALFGELAKVYDENKDWAWVQLAADGYVGYVRSSALSPQVTTPTHRVSALGTFLYATADMKAAPLMPLSMNAQLSIAEVGPGFSRLLDGTFVPSRHIVESNRFVADFVTSAERFVGVPYLWGGKTRFGIDCSGLVQTALQAAGRGCPRDSDMQEAELGQCIAGPDLIDALERGDLVFWKGHVGVMTDGFMLLHANAHHMAAVIEPVRGAIERIARGGLQISSVKRLGKTSAPGATAR